MNFKKMFEKVKLNSIVINIDSDYNGDFPIGSSKLGGEPDLPADFSWYYFKGKSQLDGAIKERPLSFLAQINCEEIISYDLEKRLPKKGILYFFYELNTMLWGFDPKDFGFARVYYYDGPVSSLRRTEYPKDIEKEFILPEIKISFNSKYNVPAFEELYSEYDIDLWDKYDECLEQLGYGCEDSSSKLLGYSDNIQGDMLLECELVTNGLYCGDSTGYISPRSKELEPNANEWKLLFQLDTVSKGDFELMFGDGGRIYYFIKESDLKNKDFDKAWMILQCG